MSGITKEPYKGCRDFFPKEKRQLEYLFNKMKQVANSYGYEPYDGPLIESVELYKAKSGEELINDQIYAFIDRGDRQVAIRPEMTPTLARMVAQIHRETPKPLRWYAIPNLMRYEKPQKGRLREHWQFNCDIFGAKAGLGEVEILLLVKALLESFGASASHAEILINDRRIVDALFAQRLQLSTDTIYKLYKIVDRSKKITAEELNRQLTTLSLSSLQQSEITEYLRIDSLEKLKYFLKKMDLEGTATEFYNLLELSNASGLEAYLKYDPSIVRGLDYYTGLVFEVFDKNPANRRAICGGGAYANLLQIFNEPALPGVGFGLGDVTLTDFLQVHELMPKEFNQELDLLVSYQTEEAQPQAFQLAESCRKAHLNTELLFGAQAPKKVFQYADRKGHSFALLIGENELREKTVQAKNLKTKVNMEFSLNNDFPDSLCQWIHEQEQL